MSKSKLPEQTNSEEIDLGQLFKLIGNAFDRLFNFIGSIFKAIFSVFIYALKAIVANYKILGIAMVLAGILGFVIERTQEEVYASQMLVKPYFDSKYQLVTNINYYNALIQEKDYNQLMKIFDIDSLAARDIIEFEINPGPETENDRIVQYEGFIKAVDSTRALEMSYDDYVENRSIYGGNFFEISVKSHQKDVFKSLEDGLNSTFENTYSVKKMKKRDSIIVLEKQRILKSLENMDSLKSVYIKVMQDDINSKIPTITSRDGISLVQERVKTKEYELLTEELKLRQQLTGLETKKVEEDVYFDTLSSFQDIGALYTSIWKKYSLIFPISVFLLLCLVYLVKKFVKYVRLYEG